MIIIMRRMWQIKEEILMELIGFRFIIWAITKPWGFRIRIRIVHLPIWKLQPLLPVSNYKLSTIMPDACIMWAGLTSKKLTSKKLTPKFEINCKTESTICKPNSVALWWVKVYPRIPLKLSTSEDWRQLVEIEIGA